jgi:hypothetical protein
MLPEILTYEPRRRRSFPDNGRKLTDADADTVLAVLADGKVMEDKVGPRADLLAEFPYLGQPHNG